jgi:glycolate oxidase FAD binding subunit
MATAQLQAGLTISPTTPIDVAEAVRAAHDASDPIHLIGGGTALRYGIAPTRSGRTLELTGLSKVVDYTPRDMTILVETGVRTADLAATLANEGQQLPVDVPRASEATIGGVVATNWSGPRRCGYGTVRDYVIGIHAVDGRGVSFRGGGRVVKNVAGYDFCKLLTGSLGTLAVITQLALKLKPIPECSATIVAPCANLATAERLLGRLAEIPATPAAVDLLIGAGWGFEGESRHLISVRLEGTESEIAWLAEQTQIQLSQGGDSSVRQLSSDEAARLWRQQVEFSDRGPQETPDESALVIKISAPPSSCTEIISQMMAIDPACAIQSHAANGIIIARFARFQPSDLTRVLVGKLRPAAVQKGGSLVILSSTLEGLTPHLVWGGRTDATVLLERIKQKFDPRGILNPGRFAY